MKKIIFAILMTLFLVSCQSSSDKYSKSPEYKQYMDTVQLIEKQASFSEVSENFSVNVETTKTDSGLINYYLIIENPRATMLDVTAMVIVSGEDPEERTFPSIGIIENKEYNLVPAQVNPEAGYVEGLMLSGQTTQNPIELKLMVSWTSPTQEIQVREFIQIVVEVE